MIASFMDSTFVRPCMSYGVALADADGRYAIEDLPAGLFVVLNVLEGEAGGASASPHVQQARVESGKRTSLDLPGGRRGTAVEGTLLRSDDTPLPDCDVILVRHGVADADWKSSRSGAGGRFEFQGLAPGTYSICVGEGLGTQMALQGQIEVPNVPVFRPVVRAGSGVLRGRVHDAGSGDGLAGAAVILEVRSGPDFVFAGKVMTDSRGRYVVRFVPDESYRVTAFSSTGRYGQETVDGVAVRAGAETVRDFPLHPGAALALRIADAFGKSLVGASVRFRDPDGTAVSFSPDDVSDGGGVLRVNGIKPGRWTVSASHDGHVTTSRTVDLAVGAEHSFEIVLPSVQ